ncbi:MAG: amidohydrolase [bacterium]
MHGLAASGGRIVALGGTDELAAAFRGYERVDLGGATALPGFVDSHIHLAPYGIALRRLNVAAVRSLPEAVEAVAAAVARERPGAWILGRGWDKNVWPEDRFPSAADLDAVSPHHPVALSSKDGHLLWVNTAALRLAGVTGQTPDPPGGEIARDRRGEPVGIFKEESAKALVGKVIPSGDTPAIERGIHDAAAMLHRVGITGVHSFVGTEAYEGGKVLSVLQQLAARGALRLRVWATLPLGELEAAAAGGRRSGVGDEWLRVGPVKVFADGTLGSQTASMLEPFDGQPHNSGIAIHSREELIAIVRRAVAAGFWCAIHAIGDRANRWVLDAYEASEEASRRLGARHRIEHVQVLHPDDLPRLARMGVTASMQPIHATSDRDIADRYWGTRSRTAYAWRSLLRAGTALAFGSDAPVETPDPWQGIYAAVTRRRPGDSRPAWYPDETLSVEEAVRAYTVGAARASGEEGIHGSLAPGRLADFIALDRDVMTEAPRDPEVLLQVRVLATVIAGVPVYEAGPLAGLSSSL